MGSRSTHLFFINPSVVVDAMLKLAEVTAEDVAYDLGCGDGWIPVAAAKTYGARAFGVRLDPERIAEARQSAKRAGVEQLVRVDQGDIFDLDLSEATVVTRFLSRDVNRRLLPPLIEPRPAPGWLPTTSPSPACRPTVRFR